jgi:hypothetical protein
MWILLVADSVMNHNGNFWYMGICSFPSGEEQLEKFVLLALH